jgi:hypothetical protein
MTNKLGPTLVELSVAEGRLRNARELLRAMLNDRFGTVPEALLQRIEARQRPGTLADCRTASVPDPNVGRLASPVRLFP